MSRRESHSAIIERNTLWQGAYATEPYEAAWASEAIFFIRALDVQGSGTTDARVQISPDGIHWCDEGATITLPTEVDFVTFVRVSHFGGWLRLVGDTGPDAGVKVIVYLTLKS